MDKIDGRTPGIDKNNNVEIYKYVAAFFFVLIFIYSCLHVCTRSIII